MNYLLYSITALLCSLLIGLCSCNKAADDGSTARAAAPGSASVADSTLTVDLAVKGMHCASCSQAIQTEIGKLDGVSSVEASFEGSHALISYNPQKLSEQQIRDEIASLGFTVSGYANPPAAADDDSEAIAGQSDTETGPPATGT